MFAVRKILLLLLLVAVLTACSNSFRNTYIQSDKIEKRRTVAVLPLVNLTPHPQAGRIVGDILTTELYMVPQLQIIERTEMIDDLLADAEADVEFAMDKMVAKRAGEQLGVDAVVYGSVSEFRYKRGLDQSPAVGINVRMLDVTTGETLWASSSSLTGGCFFTCDDSLNRLAQKACHDIVLEMLGKKVL